MNCWVFGYGSLIWRPDFAFLDRQPARLQGWTRRFWQGSHDHRGTPQAPGRVVTLVADAASCCDGVAYLIDAAVRERVFDALDVREQNGYQRYDVTLRLGAVGEPVAGLVYIAPLDNSAFLGPAPLDVMARHIGSSAGPSGHNVEYLLELADALRALGADDAHVFELEAAVRRLDRLAQTTDTQAQTS
jgi:cation transport regulator ChaC